MIDRLSERGCEPMRWQDWLRETAADPIRAAAQIALAEAPTARTAAVLLDQFHGALAHVRFERCWMPPRRRLANGEQRSMRSSPIAAWACISRQPWRVVLAGRPNVGKSSLMNALVGFQRAIVCDLPGTTRDVVTATTAIDGWPIQLADTAGLRETRDEIESAGVDAGARRGGRGRSGAAGRR